MTNQNPYRASGVEPEEKRPISRLRVLLLLVPLHIVIVCGTVLVLQLDIMPAWTAIIPMTALGVIWLAYRRLPVN